MEANNLSKERFNADNMKSQFLVLPLGFDGALIERIKNIFKLERPDSRVYRVAASPDESIDMLLLNHDNPMALHKKDILLRTVCPQAVVIAVSQGPLVNPVPHHIRGMLTASRLLSVLDKVPGRSAPASKTIPINTELRLTQDIAAPISVLGKVLQSPPVTNSTLAPVNALSGYKALVVDDSLAIQTSIKLKLETIDQISVIDFADSGEVALEKAEKTQYDLIFLDVMMPGIDGYETCTRLRKKAEYKKIPIIMVSGKTSPLDEVKGVMAGCTTYLSKPVEDQAFRKLSVRVLNWLSDRKAVGVIK